MAATNPGTTDLKAWWQLDEVNGNAIDSHGTNDLTDNGTVGSVVDGTMGRVRDLDDGIPEFFSIADNADISMGDTDWTLGLFMYPDDDTTADILDKYSAANNGPTVFYNGAGGQDRCYFNLYVGGVAKGAAATPVNSIQATTWSLLTIYHSATANEVGASVNGGAYVTGATTAAAVDGDAFGIGRRVTAGDPFDGRVFMGFKYDKILTEDNALWLYNGGVGRQYSEVAFVPKVAVVMCDLGETCEKIKGLWRPRNLGLLRV